MNGARSYDDESSCDSFRDCALSRTRLFYCDDDDSGSRLCFGEFALSCWENGKFDWLILKFESDLHLGERCLLRIKIYLLLCRCVRLPLLGFRSL